MMGFWKAWIVAWCWGVILFGAVLAAGALEATDGVVRGLYPLLSNGPIHDAFLDAPALRFSVALMGAVTLGWGFTILFLLPAIEAAGAPAWRGLTAALVIWFIIDGAVSIVTGFGMNVLSNIVLALAYAVPVFASGAMKTARRRV